MKRSIALLILAVVLLSTVSLMGVGLLEALSGSKEPIASSGVAGWMAAIGTFVAVGAGFLVAHLQQEANRRLESEKKSRDDVRRLETIKAIFSQISRMASLIQDGMNQSTMFAVGPNPWLHLEDRMACIQSLPLFEIPSSKVIVEVLGTPRAIERLGAAMKVLYAQSEEEGPFEHPAGPDVESAISNLLRKCDIIIQICDEEIQSRNSSSK